MNKRKVQPYRYYKNELQKALKFTDEDLEANQRGYVTDAQARELKIQAFRDSAFCFLPFLFIFGEGIWGSVINPEVHARYLFCLTPIYIVTLAVGIAETIRIGRAYGEDLTSDPSTATGIISFRGYRRPLFMHIEDERFEVTDAVYQSLRNVTLPAKNCIVYYTAKSKKLLSAEKLVN